MCTSTGFVPCDLWPGSSDLDCLNLMAPAVSSVFELWSPNLVCTLPMQGRWALACLFAPLALKLWPCPLNSCGTYCVSRISGTHSICNLPMLDRCAVACFWDQATFDFEGVALTFNSCATSCGQSIEATVSKLCMPIVIGEYICTSIFVRHCFLYVQSCDLDL